MASAGDVALVRVEAPHLCAGVIVDRETAIVVYAAPILRWSVGKNIEHLVAWATKNGYKIEEIP
jgi:hypothetical protein